MGSDSEVIYEQRVPAPQAARVLVLSLFLLLPAEMVAMWQLVPRLQGGQGASSWFSAAGGGVALLVAALATYVVWSPSVWRVTRSELWVRFAGLRRLRIPTRDIEFCQEATCAAPDQGDRSRQGARPREQWDAMRMGRARSVAVTEHSGRRTLIGSDDVVGLCAALRSAGVEVREGAVEVPRGVWGTE